MCWSWCCMMGVWWVLSLGDEVPAGECIPVEGLGTEQEWMLGILGFFASQGQGCQDGTEG